MFLYNIGPTERSHIKDGLLWWDLNNIKKVEIPAERNVSMLLFVLQIEHFYKPSAHDGDGPEHHSRLSSAPLVKFEIQFKMASVTNRPQKTQKMP